MRLRSDKYAVNYENAIESGEFDWDLAGEAYFVGFSKAYRKMEMGRPLRVEARYQLDGSAKWVVEMDGFVLGMDGQYHLEPIPSNRDETFRNLTQFPTKEEAFKALVEHERSLIGKEAVLTVS